MTRDAQASIDSHRDALEHERAQVSRLQYALVQSEEEQQKRRPTRDADHPERDVTTQARQSLERGRARWKRIWRTQVNCKAAIQHILEQLEPLRLDEELVTPLTDDTMVPLLQQAEKKLMRIAAAFLEEEQRHAQILKSSADFALKQPPPPQSPGLGMGSRPGRHDADDSEEEFEEDLEEDVPDREALKRQAHLLVDKGAKKTKKRKPKKVKDEAESPAKGAASMAPGGLA